MGRPAQVRTACGDEVKRPAFPEPVASLPRHLGIGPGLQLRSNPVHCLPRAPFASALRMPGICKCEIALQGKRKPADMKRGTLSFLRGFTLPMMKAIPVVLSGAFLPGAPAQADEMDRALLSTFFDCQHRGIGLQASQVLS